MITSISIAFIIICLLVNYVIKHIQIDRESSRFMVIVLNIFISLPIFISLLAPTFIIFGLLGLVQIIDPKTMTKATLADIFILSFYVGAILMIYDLMEGLVEGLIRHFGLPKCLIRIAEMIVTTFLVLFISNNYVNTINLSVPLALGIGTISTLIWFVIESTFKKNENNPYQKK